MQSPKPGFVAAQKMSVVLHVFGRWLNPLVPASRHCHDQNHCRISKIVDRGLSFTEACESLGLESLRAWADVPDERRYRGTVQQSSRHRPDEHWHEVACEYLGTNLSFRNSDNRRL